MFDSEELRSLLVDFDNNLKIVQDLIENQAKYQEAPPNEIQTPNQIFQSDENMMNSEEMQIQPPKPKFKIVGGKSKKQKKIEKFNQKASSLLSELQTVPSMDKAHQLISQSLADASISEDKRLEEKLNAMKNENSILKRAFLTQYKRNTVPSLYF